MTNTETRPFDIFSHLTNRAMYVDSLSNALDSARQARADRSDIDALLALYNPTVEAVMATARNLTADQDVLNAMVSLEGKSVGSENGSIIPAVFDAIRTDYSNVPTSSPEWLAEQAAAHAHREQNPDDYL